jgi:hypothetical protein
MYAVNRYKVWSENKELKERVKNLEFEVIITTTIIYFSLN